MVCKSGWGKERGDMLRHTKGKSFISIFHIQYCVSADSFVIERGREKQAEEESVCMRGKADRREGWESQLLDM